MCLSYHILTCLCVCVCVCVFLCVGVGAHVCMCVFACVGCVCMCLCRVWGVCVCVCASPISVRTLNQYSTTVGTVTGSMLLMPFLKRAKKEATSRGQNANSM